MQYGLYRIEHMQAMISARDEKTRRKAPLRLLPMQRKDFAGLFEAMDGFPSCSSYRVPIARVAAAQAAISGDKSETQRTA